MSFLQQTCHIFLDLSIHILPIVELADFGKSKNISIFLYRSQADDIGFSIFNNQSLSYNLNGGKNCFEDPYPYKCEIKSSQIALFLPEEDNDLDRFVAVKSSETLNGCIFTETVFATRNGVITGIANSQGYCDIILFSAPESYFYIDLLFTTAKTETVKVFIGLDKTRLYFEFNSVTAKKWQQIGLFSRSYIIEIPINATLFIKLQSADVTTDYFSIEFPHQSLITTANFGISKNLNEVNDLPLAGYQSSNNGTLKFTALYYNLSVNGIFYFQIFNNSNQTDTKIVHINKTGDSVTIHNKLVLIYYNYAVATDEVMLFVETINNREIIY